jgi:hypothetical protein
VQCSLRFRSPDSCCAVRVRVRVAAAPCVGGYDLLYSYRLSALCNLNTAITPFPMTNFFNPLLLPLQVRACVSVTPTPAHGWMLLGGREQATCV